MRSSISWRAASSTEAKSPRATYALNLACCSEVREIAIGSIFSYPQGAAPSTTAGEPLGTGTAAGNGKGGTQFVVTPWLVESNSVI